VTYIRLTSVVSIIGSSSAAVAVEVVVLLLKKEEEKLDKDPKCLALIEDGNSIGGNPTAVMTKGKLSML
jgi:hypothetical protein